MAPKCDHVLGSLSPVSLLTITRTKSMLAWYSLSTSSSSLTVFVVGEEGILGVIELQEHRHRGKHQGHDETHREYNFRVSYADFSRSVKRVPHFITSLPKNPSDVISAIRGAFQFSSRNRPISSDLLGFNSEEEARCPGSPDNFEERPAQEDDQGSR